MRLLQFLEFESTLNIRFFTQKTMHGYVANIEELTEENKLFRKVLYTSKHLQLVVMSIPIGGDIGEEVHELDQFLRIESGEGKVVLNGKEHPLHDGDVIVVPQGTTHNIINMSQSVPLQIYTLYGPPNHKDQTVHKTKADAEAHEEHFDGVTTE